MRTDITPDIICSLSDEELIKFAAKACGYTLVRQKVPFGCEEDELWCKELGGQWDPLHSLDVALMLSFKLRIDIEYDRWLEAENEGVECVARDHNYEEKDGDGVILISPWSYAKFTGNEREDTLALCKAIVRAAAWIGMTKSES
jgi:hypothetical protein